MRLLLLLLLLAACCCCCCCLLKRVAQPWPLKGGVKPRQGKPSSVINCYFRAVRRHSLLYHWEGPHQCFAPLLCATFPEAQLTLHHPYQLWLHLSEALLGVKDTCAMPGAFGET